MWLGLLLFSAAFYISYELTGHFGAVRSAGDEPECEGAVRSTPRDERAERIRELISQGYVSKAVKLYEEQHGVSMVAAMDAIDKLQKELSAQASDSNPQPDLDLASDDRANSEIEAFIAQGNKIAAIKRYREITGLGLKEAKDIIDAMATGKLSLRTHLTAGTLQTASNPETTEVLEDPELLQCLKAGRKIAAMKRYRELTGAGLADAKEAVDALARSESKLRNS